MVSNFLFSVAVHSSHAYTVVRECCKDDHQSQWERVNFDPQPTLNPSSARLPARPLDGFWRSVMMRFCARKYLLGVRKFKINIWLIYSKNSKKKLQWLLWETFKNSSNCHNFRCVQHRVVIFGSTYGFRGRPIQRCHLNLPPTNPCCHGNEIWD